MNGNRARQTSFSSSPDARYGAGLHGQVQPAARVLLEGYTGGNQQRYDTMGRGPFPTASTPNTNDPVITQLLLETAMGDSQQFQILSHEEADATKQELSILSTRIDGTKRKLVLETKLRDAAQSLNRLHETPETVEGSPKSPKRHRGSAMGSRGSLGDMLNKTDDEMADSARKCDDLAQELWSLEKREETLMKRLLEHTAGVLQRTHKGFLERDDFSLTRDSVNGYSSGRRLCEPFDLTREFADDGFFPSLDSFLEPSGTHGNGSVCTVDPDFSQHTQAILETERKLENLNHRLQESIMQFQNTSQSRPVPPLGGLENGQSPESLLSNQLYCLEGNISAIQHDQDASKQEAKQSAYITEERLGHLNTQLREIVTRSFQGQKSEYPLPPEIAGHGPEFQVGYLEAGLDAVEQAIQRLVDDNSSLTSQNAGHEGKADQNNTILLGLWEILVGGEEEIWRQNPIQREVHEEEFSTQAFSAKVQTLFARATGLEEQKEILTRQVQQQRELNSKSDPDNDAKISEVSLELEQANQSLAEKEREVKETRENLLLTTERVNAMRQEASLLEQQRNMSQTEALAAEKEARRESHERLFAELEGKQRQIIEFESELAETKDDLAISNAEMLGKLDESDRRIQSLNTELQNSKSEKEKSQSEMRELEGQMVLLQTELTVAKAELDGAYGTRAQRAAEQAANPAKQQEFNLLTSQNQSLTEELEELRARHQTAERANSDLIQHVQTLQRELTETIGEYEAMTRASIEFEREREQLESNLDAIRERCESVESQLSEEKVRWLGVNCPGSTRDSMNPGTTSTQVLKNEFKKMMRDTRAENMRALRYEQEERRKLEALVRSMKRDQTPGKSSLSQSMTAS